MPGLTTQTTHTYRQNTAENARVLVKEDRSYLAKTIDNYNLRCQTHQGQGQNLRSVDLG